MGERASDSGAFGLAFPCYEMMRQFGDERARGVCIGVAEVILHRTKRNHLGMVILWAITGVLRHLPPGDPEFSGFVADSKEGIMSMDATPMGWIPGLSTAYEMSL